MTIPSEDNTMKLENCQESRTKQKEEEEKMPHFLLRGELNSFPLRSCFKQMITFSPAGWVSLLKGGRGNMVTEPNNKDNDDDNNSKWSLL